MQGWLRTVADINPVTHVVEAVRQGFVDGSVTFSGTWPAFAALAGLIARARRPVAARDASLQHCAR